MKKEDLDALAGLYEGVYSPVEHGEYLTEVLDTPLGFQARRQRAASQSAAAQSAKDAVKNASQAQKNKAAETIFKLKPGSLQKPAVKPTLTDAEFDKKYGTNNPNNNLAKPETGKPRVNPAKPATPGANAQKVAPTAAAKPKFTPQTGDKAKDTATWAKANPTLANKPKTPNPLMQKTFGYQTGNAPDQVAKTAADTAKAASNLSGTGALAAKPTPSTSPIRKPGAVMSSFEWGSKATLKDVASLYSSIYEAKKKDQDQDGDNDFADVRIARMIASGMSKAEAIAAVKNKPYNEEYGIKVPAGASDAEALKGLIPKGSKVHEIKKKKPTLQNASYEPESDMLDEATRMRKELGKEGETRVRGELAARSRAHKRSGSVDKTIAAAERGADRPYVKFKRDESDADRKKREEKQSKVLRGLAASRRGSVRDKPRAGLRGYAAKVTGSDKDLQTARQRAMSAGTLTPKEKKQLGEEYEIYEIVASYLLENNFAETLNDANVIIENMSETWVAQILESFE